MMSCFSSQICLHAFFFALAVMLTPQDLESTHSNDPSFAFYNHNEIEAILINREDEGEYFNRCCHLSVLDTPIDTFFFLFQLRYPPHTQP